MIADVIRERSISRLEKRNGQLGVSTFVSLGNKADVSGNDLLEYWENDPKTKVVLMYLEAFGNPRRFIPIARRFSRKKPIVCVKAGRTAAPEALIAFARERLAGFKTPKRVVFGDLPKTATGKIQKFKLRDEARR